jgi:plastocyanin
MIGIRLSRWLFCLLVIAQAASGRERSPADIPEVRLHIVSSQPGPHHAVPAVIWLQPLVGTPALAFQPHGHYTVLQRNRTFVPHLQVVPVGSVIQFPNLDPFFHNVFSLFEGKRFDLGLYEAGSSKSVTFSREGVSYIFCNIHPEMGAVVLALSTPLYAIADENERFALRNAPPGHYRLHVWIEGVPQSVLDGLGRAVEVPPHAIDLGELQAPILRESPTTHTNKFDRPYDKDPPATY